MIPMIMHLVSRRRLPALVGVFAAVLIAVVGITGQFASSAAYAAAPYIPPGGVIDCYEQANANGPGCDHLSKAYSCIESDRACFTTHDAASTEKSWWVETTLGYVCEGTDISCQSSLDDSAQWTLDHFGPSPNLPADEIEPKVATKNTPPDSDILYQWQINGATIIEYENGQCWSSIPGSADASAVTRVACPNTTGDKCVGEVNDFSTCGIGTLSNGLEFYALAISFGGMLFSVILWALGSRGQNPGQELTGKRGLIVCLTCAFVVGAVPGLIGYFNTQTDTVDPTGITQVTDPSAAGSTGGSGGGGSVGTGQPPSGDPKCTFVGNKCVGQVPDPNPNPITPT